MKITEIITEAANPAQQAAIAISMKKVGKKPKRVDEADMNRRGFLKGASAAAASCGLAGCGGLDGGIFDTNCSEHIDDSIKKYGNPGNVYKSNFSDGSYIHTYWWYNKGIALTFKWGTLYGKCNVDSFTFRSY